MPRGSAGRLHDGSQPCCMYVKRRATKCATRLNFEANFVLACHGIWIPGIVHGVYRNLQSSRVSPIHAASSFAGTKLNLRIRILFAPHTYLVRTYGRVLKSKRSRFSSKSLTILEDQGIYCCTRTVHGKASGRWVRIYRNTLPTQYVERIAIPPTCIIAYVP